MVSITLLIFSLGISVKIYKVGKLQPGMPANLINLCFCTTIVGFVSCVKAYRVESQNQLIERAQKYKAQYQLLNKSIAPTNKIEENQ